MTSMAPLAGESSISDADHCYRCDYDLHGISNDQPCPECGLLAERSRRLTDELHDTRPKWLRNLSRGTKLILLALIVGAVWPSIMQPLEEHIWRTTNASGIRPWWANFLGYEIFPFAGFDLAAVWLATGAWLLTTREGYAASDRADRWRRRILRVAALAPIIAMIILHVLVPYIGATLFFRSSATRNRIDALWIGFWCVLAAGLIPSPLLLFLQFCSLAKRVRSAHLAEHCTIVGIGASCSLLFLALVALIFQFSEQLGLPHNWTNRATISLLLPLAGLVGSGLFLLWSLYLLIHFTISFQFAAKAMRVKWNRDDRSLTSAPPGVA